MRNQCKLLMAVFCLLNSASAVPQDKPKGADEFNEFNAKPRDGWVWDEDERLDDLIQQLQEKELALQEVDALSARLIRKRVGSKSAANMAWRSMDRMDLNGGGPIRWDVFYGRNAENFFYHPVDRNTTYHTTTVLQQVQPTSTGSVPGNQGVPTHQRPPQFDYIYRGYERRQTQAQEQARALTNKVAELTSRRRQLESEVVLLWFKLAFRVIDRDKIPEKPVLRFAVMPETGNRKEDVDRAVALNEATQLLAVALLLNEARVKSQPEKAFSTVSDLIKKQRKQFEDSLIRLGTILDESEDRSVPIGQYKFLARRLEDTSKSLTEGYSGWRDGDQADDEPTKFTGLRRVQDSIVRYSKICLALNELVDVMKREWDMRINTDSEEFVPQWDVVYVSHDRRIVPRSKREDATSRPSDQHPQGLHERLKGKTWQNANNAIFAWDSQGIFTHNGLRRNWAVVGKNVITITFGPGHVDTLVFSDDLQTFRQYSTSAPQRSGRPLFTGRMK